MMLTSRFPILSPPVLCRLSAVLISLVHVACLRAQSTEWVKYVSSDIDDASRAVSCDGLGGIYITGTTRRSAAGPSSGDSAFVSKFDSLGRRLWLRKLESDVGGDFGEDVSADKLGNVFVSGTTIGSLGGSYAGMGDAFVGKYDSEGNQKWVRQIGTPYSDFGSGVAADNRGNVFVAGTTLGSLGLANLGGPDAFLRKYSGSGAIMWTRQIGGDANVGCSDVAADQFGNAYITGSAGSALSGQYNAGGFDAYVIKYGPAGNQLWTREFGTIRHDYGMSVAPDSFGNVYVTGYTEGSLGTPNAGGGDYFISKLDDRGNLLWSRQYGGEFDDVSLGVSIDADGNAYIAGFSTIRFSGSNYVGRSPFVMKLSAAGDPLWTYSLAPLAGESLGVAADRLGSVYTSGYAYNGTRDPFLAKINSQTIPEAPSSLLFATGGAAIVLRLGKKSRWSKFIEFGR